MSEVTEHFPSQTNVPDIKTDGMCHCPVINEEDVIEGKHKYCGGKINVNQAEELIRKQIKSERRKKKQ